MGLYLAGNIFDGAIEGDVAAHVAVVLAEHGGNVGVQHLGGDGHDVGLRHVRGLHRPIPHINHTPIKRLLPTARQVIDSHLLYPLL